MNLRHSTPLPLLICGIQSAANFVMVTHAIKARQTLSLYCNLVLRNFIGLHLCIQAVLWRHQQVTPGTVQFAWARDCQLEEDPELPLMHALLVVIDSISVILYSSVNEIASGLTLYRKITVMVQIKAKSLQWGLNLV